MKQLQQTILGLSALGDDEIQSCCDIDMTDDGDIPGLTADNQTTGCSNHDDHGQQELTSRSDEMVLEPRLENVQHYSALSAAPAYSIDDVCRRSSSFDQVRQDSRQFRNASLQFMDPFGPTEFTALSNQEKHHDFQSSPQIPRGDQFDDDFPTFDEIQKEIEDAIAITKFTNQIDPSKRHHRVFHQFDGRWFSFEKCYMGDITGELFPVYVPCSANENGNFPCDGHCLFGFSQEAVSRYTCKVPNCSFKVLTASDNYRLLASHVQQHLNVNRIAKPTDNALATIRLCSQTTHHTTNTESPRSRLRATVHRREKRENCPHEGCNRNVGRTMRSDNLLKHLRDVHGTPIPRKRAPRSSTCTSMASGRDLATRESPTGGSGPQ